MKTLFLLVFLSFTAFAQNDTRNTLPASPKFRELLSGGNCAGKPMCAFVYVTPWCPRCITNEPMFKQWMEKFKDDQRVGIRLVVGKEKQPGDNKRYAEKYGPDALIDDADSTIGNAAEVKSFPTIYLSMQRNDLVASSLPAIERIKMLIAIAPAPMSESAGMKISDYASQASCAGKKSCLIVYVTPWCPQCAGMMSTYQAWVKKNQTNKETGLLFIVGLENPEQKKNSEIAGLLGANAMIDVKRNIVNVFPGRGFPRYALLENGSLKEQGDEAKRWGVKNFE